MALTPKQRSARSRMAAYVMHSRHDSRVTSAPGRAAFAARFEQEVDPDGTLDPEERARRAAMARKAFYLNLSYMAATKRTKVAKARATRRERSNG